MSNKNGNGRSGLDHKLNKPIGSDDLIWHVHEYNIDPYFNHIYLFGNESRYSGDAVEIGEPGVEFMMANNFIRNMNICMRSRPDKPILIHMKTCGGLWEEGMAIYDAIKSCPSPTTILSYTHARSMSSLIFLAANKRVMMPNSKFMLHDGTIAFDGTVKQFWTEGEELKKASDTMMDIYIDALKEQGKLRKWSRQRINDWLREQMDKKEEVYFSAEQSIRYGFADEIFGADGKYDWPALTKYTAQQKNR